MGRFEAANAVARAGPDCGSGWGPPLGGPGSIRGSAVRTKAANRSPHSQLQRWADHAPRAQGLPRSGATSGPANLQRPGRHQAGENRRPAPPQYQRGCSLGGLGLFRTASLEARLKPDCPCSRPCRPRRLPQDRLGLTIGLPITSSWARPPGLGWGSHHRAWSPPRFPSADCAVSPSRKGRGWTGRSRPTFWAEQRHAHTGGHRQGPRGGSCGAPGARQQPVHLGKSDRAPSVVSTVTSSRVGSGQSACAASGHRAAWGAASAWLPAAACTVISSAPRRAALPTARPWWLGCRWNFSPETPQATRQQRQTDTNDEAPGP